LNFNQALLNVLNAIIQAYIIITCFLHNV